MQYSCQCFILGFYNRFVNAGSLEALQIDDEKGSKEGPVRNL